MPWIGWCRKTNKQKNCFHTGLKMKSKVTMLVGFSCSWRSFSSCPEDSLFLAMSSHDCPVTCKTMSSTHACVEAELTLLLSSPLRRPLQCHWIGTHPMLSFNLISHLVLLLLLPTVSHWASNSTYEFGRPSFSPYYTWMVICIWIFHTVKTEFNADSNDSIY